MKIKADINLSFYNKKAEVSELSQNTRRTRDKNASLSHKL